MIHDNAEILSGNTTDWIIKANKWFRSQDKTKNDDMTLAPYTRIQNTLPLTRKLIARMRSINSESVPHGRIKAYYYACILIVGNTRFPLVPAGINMYSMISQMITLLTMKA